MLLQVPPALLLFLSFDRFFKWALFFIGILLLVIATLFFRLLISEAPMTIEELKRPVKEQISAENQCVDICSGPLYLDNDRERHLLNLLASQIELVAASIKPGSIPNESLLVQFKGSDEKRVLHKGEGVELIAGQLNLTLLENDGKKALFLADLSLDGREKYSRRIEKSFSTAPSNQTLLYSGEASYPACFKELASARYLGSDALLAIYGGSAYKGVASKGKILLGQAEERFLLLGAGDLIRFDAKGGWRLCREETLFPGEPLARIKELSAHEMVIDCWDETGFQMFRIQLSLASKQSVYPMLDKVFTSMRLRTAKEVTALLGKRRIVVREGDWWLKIDHTWRCLRKLKEIEDCIDNKLKGELFIFDKLQKKRGGYALTGHFFDSFHVESQKIEIPIHPVDERLPSPFPGDLEKRVKKKKSLPLRLVEKSKGSEIK